MYTEFARKRKRRLGFPRSKKKAGIGTYMKRGALIAGGAAALEGGIRSGLLSHDKVKAARIRGVHVPKKMARTAMGMSAGLGGAINAPLGAAGGALIGANIYALKGRGDRKRKRGLGRGRRRRR